MLANYPANVPNRFKLGSQACPESELDCLRLLRHGRCSCVFGFTRSSSDTIVKKKLSKHTVLVRASYTRKQLETPGAYQLVDNETGEKFILWGGIDDDSSIPSKEVLSWKPGLNFNPEQANLPKSTHSNIGNGEENRGSTGNFGRLKTQRVRALVKRTTQMKQDITKRDTHIKAEEPQDSDIRTARPDVSVPRVSAAPLKKGWGGEGFRYDSTDVPQRRRRLSNEGAFFSKKSFRDVGCSDYMVDALRVQLIHRPSHIQAVAFTPVLEGKSCIIADQSGSGKTLAYLAPLIQRLRQEELQGLVDSSSKSPRVVILVPTAELASQVLVNCRSLSKFGVPFRSVVATGGFRQKTQLQNLQESVDVLIATPGRFMYLCKEGFLQLTSLRCAVLDEVDILFNDEDFGSAFQSLISSSPVATQYLFVTATLRVDIYNKLVELFPDSKVIMGPGMHRTSPGLEEVLVDCSGDERAEKTSETAFLNKRFALLQLVEENPVSKTIVFCNKIETCRKVENVLKRFDRKGSNIRVLPFHAALAQESRLANMKQFLNSRPGEDALFLICTDRASRGIDFTGVDHVILFDFPRDPSEYIRRVGRTARGAGGKGKAFVFVVGKQVSLARRIMERNLKGHPLHDVPSAFELMF